ncbi:MuDR family transposase [Abeliophyllum distichum]|uniref:MuDR family transposase n=1 Tax=Abeliophyllum distichum TaxID=126358 RepID=A0ABD1VQP0_9LAMI
MCNLNHGTISIKYFLPGNSRNLITLRNDKDLQRMIDFHGNSVTADVFVDGKEGFDRDAVKVQANRGSDIKLAETVNPVAPSTDTKRVVNDVQPCASRANAAPKNVHSPVYAPGSTVAADATAESSGRSRASTASTPSSGPGADCDSDYAPLVELAVHAAAQTSTGLLTGGSPADTVKKRRRTASRKIVPRGPTTFAAPDNGRKRRPRKKNIAVVNDNLDEHQRYNLLGDGDHDSPSGHDDDLPENLVLSWKDCIIGVGQEFKSVKEFREALQKYAIAHRFVYKLKKNDTIRARGICVAEGCSWKIHASRDSTSQSFQIKKFNNTHTCGGESWKNENPAKKWLVGVIKNRLRESPHHKTKEIANSISQDFGIQLSYTQVRRRIRDAREQLQGSYKKSYNWLPWFCKMAVETNPGSIVKVVTNDEKRLKCLFVSFYSSIHGFQGGCRPILFLESTSLRSKFREILLTATAVDADDGFFPVAFAIVDVENKDNWLLFLKQLKSSMSTSQSITFISDREKGLKQSILEVFENACHGYSMFHLMKSFKRNLKGPFHGDGRGVLPGIFLAAAHAVRLNDFKKFTEQIRQISSHVYDWVIQIEPENWTRLLFKGEHYNYVTQNVAESYTKLMEEKRELTIMQKIEALRCMMNELINSRQMESRKWTTKLTPSKEKMLEEAVLKAFGLRVFASSDILFEVHDNSTHVVNIEKWECTCLEWKESGLPCYHGIAALNCAGKNVYNYCSRYFTTETYQSTYSESINPIPGIDEPIRKENGDADTLKVIPPCPPRIPNQQEEEESKTENPDKKTVTCTRCKQLGHNKTSCKANI